MAEFIGEVLSLLFHSLLFHFCSQSEPSVNVFITRDRSGLIRLP